MTIEIVDLAIKNCDFPSRDVFLEGFWGDGMWTAPIELCGRVFRAFKSFVIGDTKFSIECGAPNKVNK